MPKVDVHTHILPPQLPRWARQFGYGGFIELEHHAPCRARMLRDDGTLFREIEANCWDAETRLRECAAVGVDVQVLSTVPVLFAYHAQPQHGLDVARYLNDHLAGVCHAQPTRFYGLGTLPLQAPELAVRELERCVRELGLAGVQVGSHVRGVNLDDAQLRPVWQRAAELGAAVFVHPWEMMGQDTMPRHWLPWLVGMPAESARALCSVIMGGLLQDFPALRLCFAHGGGSFAGTIGRIDHGWQARPDLCATHIAEPPSHWAKRVWVDALVHEPRALALALDVFGGDKLLVGSDYPFPLGEAHPGALVEAHVTDPQLRAAILWHNAWRWLGQAAPPNFAT